MCTAVTKPSAARNESGRRTSAGHLCPPFLRVATTTYRSWQETSIPGVDEGQGRGLSQDKSRYSEKGVVRVEKKRTQVARMSEEGRNMQGAKRGRERGGGVGGLSVLRNFL